MHDGVAGKVNINVKEDSDVSSLDNSTNDGAKCSMTHPSVSVMFSG